MMQQMLKLIWNRKRSNGFLIMEFLLAFLVLYAIFAAGIAAWRKYHQPNGFSTKNVLNITAYEESGESEVSANRGAILEQIANALKDMGGVEEVGHRDCSLYEGFDGFMSETSDEKINGDIVFKLAYMSVECKRVLDLDIIEGRWFSDEDNGSRCTVIDRDLRDALFGSVSPLGKKVFGSRVVGVVSDFRMEGDLAAPQRCAIFPITFSYPYFSPFHALLVKLKTASTAGMEARILTSLQSIAPTWTFAISRAEDLRAEKLRSQSLPYILAAIVSALLVFTVMLGLMGVLWQNITRRTNEIGLRRATGATVEHIFGQVLGEMLILVTAGIVPGILIITQLVFLDTLGFLSSSIHITAMAVSALVLYGIVVICSLYPGYMATRISPAAALHYE